MTGTRYYTQYRKRITGGIIAALLAANTAFSAGAVYAAQDAGLRAERSAAAATDLHRELAETQAELRRANAQLDELYTSKVQEQEEPSREVNRGYAQGIRVEVTAYDLSEASCSKGSSHPAYGLTATGKNLAGHSLESARAIAVDPDVIPLGSEVHLAFEDPEMQQYDGVYVACDTGGAIEGSRIDLFAGDGAYALAMEIGRRQATATILS